MDCEQVCGPGICGASLADNVAYKTVCSKNQQVRAREVSLHFDPTNIK
jgi:hypothetical protein